MAKRNKVIIEVEINGKMQKVAVDAKNLGKSLDDVGKNSRTADRNLKGAAQASSNATKNFSKMAQGTNGLVAAYATLAANVFAVSAAFQFLKNAGDLRALETAQAQYTSKTGMNMKLLTSRIQEASGSIISFQEASQAAAIGRAAGLTPDQLERLGAAAKNAAAALGRDTTDAFQRLTRGAIKAEPELLDELGIIIRLERVTKDYKKALNITGRELTTFEKTQAVVNATLAQAEEKFNNVEDASVNSVARLGKAFDDLVKSIQRSIVGPAEFIADVFTKNVYALSAAFALLGVNITKSLAPTVDMENLDDMVAGAKSRISSIADPSTAAGRKAASGDFSSMKTLEKAARSKTSKVLQLSKMERQQIKKDLRLIQADHARTMAANATGFKKYTLGVIANLKIMQAEHGMVMGTMKAGLGGLAKFASRAMNAIAIVGMITLAVSLGKELLNLLKSPELKQMEDTAEKLKNRFAEQNEAVQTTLLTLERESTVMGRLIQQTNIFNQLSAKGSSALMRNIAKVDVDNAFTTSMKIGTNKQKKVAVTTRNRNDESLALASAGQKTMLAQGGPLAAFLTSMKLASEQAKLAGRDTSVFDEKITQLESSLNSAAAANLDTKAGAQAYNEEIERSTGLIKQVRQAHTDLSTSLNAEANAFQSVNEAYGTFTDLQASLKGKTGPAFQLSAALKSFSTSIEGAVSLKPGQRVGSVFDADSLNKFAAALGMTSEAFATLSREQAIKMFTGAGNALEADALTLAKGSAPRDKQLAEGMQAYLPFLQQEAQHKHKIAGIDLQILELQHQKDLAAKGQIELTEEQTVKIDEQTAALRAQKDLAIQSVSDIGKLGQAIGQSLESSLGNAFTQLIMGTHSAKQAFASMAQSILASIAKIIAEMMAMAVIKKLFMGTAFGSFLGLRDGGVVSNGKRVAGYSQGGIASGSTSGYPAVLHGTEAVVPLPNGKSIPVEMKEGSAGQQVNNVVVNVSTEGNVDAQASQGGLDSENLGRAIAVAVQEELHAQKRNGGILSPYGAA